MSKVHWVGVVKWNDGTFFRTEPFYEYDEGIKVWSDEFSSKHQGEFEYIDYERFDGVVRDLEYWKNNAEEDYVTTPISVLRYISELEKDKNKFNNEEVPNNLESVLAKITHQNDLGLSQWHEVVYYDNDDDKWCCYSGSKTFQDGERVIAWRYCKDLI
jgi:hypothetical protein